MKNSKNLFAGILLFILLDLSVLAINYWIAYEMSHDAIAINLSGRQRMLSQRITKTLLVLPHTKSSDDSARAIEEFRSSAKLFDQTLSAFANGGIAVGGDGKPVALNRVNDRAASALIKEALQIWHPTRDRLTPYLHSNITIPDEVLTQSQNDMLNNNLQLLELMNRLTSSIERASLKQANALRIIQTIVFILAIINFVIIVRKFHLLAHEARLTSARYSKLALHDTLTGLFNRRYIEQQIEHELTKNQNTLTLMMLDLDGFKAINDTHSHDAGDTVLKTIAERLRQHAGNTDIVARLGGDEFIYISTRFTSKDTIAENCTQLIASINQPISLHHESAHVGVSIGVVFMPDKNHSKSDILRMADQAMYQAKKAGKNRYRFTDSLPLYRER